MNKLVLVRHGQSLWNLENKFTGWIDLSLSQEGIEEAQNAGTILSDFSFSKVFTSNLIRAQMTAFEIMKRNKNTKGLLRFHNDESSWYEHTQTNISEFTQFIEDERLNERYYGDLQGEDKDDMRKQYGEEQVKEWRRSYATQPPGGESLKDTTQRVLPFFEEKIMTCIKEENCLIVAHGNSLRAIIKYIEDLSDDEIVEVEIPTGTPIIYEFDDDGNYVKKEICS